MEHNLRNKAFHTLSFVLAVIVVLQCRVHLCWGAPIEISRSVSTAAPDAGAAEEYSNTTTNGTVATTATITTSEEQGEEVTDLQELRSGLKVLNTIAKNQLALRLQLSDEDKTALDAANNSTGIRLALTVTCSLRNTAESFERLPLNSSTPSADLNLLRTATDALFKASCSWVDTLYRVQNHNSTMNFNCSCHEMSSICSSLDMLIFTEGLERQYHTLQSSILNETRSDRWVQENIEPDSVLPEVYDVINQQP